MLLQTTHLVLSATIGDGLIVRALGDSLGRLSQLTERQELTMDEKTAGDEQQQQPYDGDDDPDTGDKMAYCPSDPDELAAKGCLYSWAAAMDSAARLNGKPDSVADYNVCGYALDCTVEAPVQGICPNGWHLPSKDEIDTLLSVASYGGEYEQMAFVALAGDTADGLNWLGFSADGVGYTVNYTSVTYPERFTLWASDDYDGYPNYSWTLYTDGASIIRDYWGKSSGRSVRCIKDQVEE